MTQEITGHWKKTPGTARDNNHLHCCDIHGKSPVKVKIEAIVAGEVVDEKSAKLQKTFLKFKGKNKILGMNVTNGHLIAIVTGEKEVQNWIGHEITLRTAVCRKEECIRVHVPAGTHIPKMCPRFDYTDKVAK